MNYRLSSSFRLTAFTAWCVLSLSSQHGLADDNLDAAQVEFFEKRIRPVLVEHCYSCHSADAKSIKGSLRLDSREALLQGGDSGPAITPGKPADSPLMSALKYEDYEMPPKGKLPARVIADFETWIKNGAIDPRAGNATAKVSVNYADGAKFWAFKKPIMGKLPDNETDPWVKNSIDQFVLARLRENKLSPSDAADRATLIRRAYFGVIGLPPTIAEVRAFVADRSEDAFAKVVDRLLESKHYGERWGRHWLDVARYGEDQAHTFKARRYPRGYYYRDWVVASLNNDMPYNQFVRTQIAGDLIEGPNQHKRLAALGLFALGPVYYAENVEKAKAAADEWDDRIDTLTRGVLGLTVSCARCHDHKYDPISMQDYYGLAGVFASTQYQERPISAESELSKKREADARVQQQQLEIDRFLINESRLLREELVFEIADYMVTAWKITNRLRKERNAKKVYQQFAKSEKLSETLLKRWVEFLKPRRDDNQKRPYLANWFKYTNSLDPKAELSENAEVTKPLGQLASEFQSVVEKIVPRKNELFARYGDNVAFVTKADRAVVKPGIIPLGNLFDDSASVSLDAALSTDRYGQAATAKSLGVDRVLQGWGARTKIAPDVSFDFGKLNTDKNTFGAVANDAAYPGEAISTQGRRSKSKRRIEQGIGMHANALITFDLDEIRKAGLMPLDQRFVFKVDRAGINDDSFASVGAAHIAVIVSKPHKDKGVTDAIIGAYVNGKKFELATDDFTYYLAGEIPPPIKADGNFISMAIPIPAEAKHLTLVSAGGPGFDGNSINNDHVVFSGVRLEKNPLPKSGDVLAKNAVTSEEAENAQDLADATVLSQLLYEDGLLAIPPKEAEGRLKDAAKKTLADQKKELEKRKKQAQAIVIAMAHSLKEGGSRDLPIYLAGNPAKHGNIAPRAMPAIFTAGETAPFESKGSGRLELANALTSDDNPLTARVIVNRVWAGHFGLGLVRTPSNFGKLGERPTHPRLLDHLAVWFMKNGWSLKKLHRLILLSSTYQQSGEYDEAKFEQDPENRLLWRMNRRRLEIEPWRDAMLLVSGDLQTDLGGPSKSLGDPNNRRRTLYGFISRHRLDELLRLFDFPDPNITADRRTTTTVPLQQLFVLNSEFMIRRARALASQIAKQGGEAESDRINFAYQAVYGREPSSLERERGIQFLKLNSEDEKNKISPLEQLSLALLASNEFMFVD